jgi:hypothetical protein
LETALNEPNHPKKEEHADINTQEVTGHSTSRSALLLQCPQVTGHVKLTEFRVL